MTDIFRFTARVKSFNWFVNWLSDMNGPYQRRPMLSLSMYRIVSPTSFRIFHLRSTGLRCTTNVDQSLGYWKEEKKTNENYHFWFFFFIVGFVYEAVRAYRSGFEYSTLTHTHTSTLTDKLNTVYMYEQAIQWLYEIW